MKATRTHRSWCDEKERDHPGSCVGYVASSATQRGYTSVLTVEEPAAGRPVVILHQTAHDGSTARLVLDQADALDLMEALSKAVSSTAFRAGRKAA